MNLNLPRKKIILLSGGVVLSIVFFYSLFLSAPKDFAEGSILSIDPGTSLRATSLKLKNEQLIRSRIFFESFIIFFAGEEHVISSDYYFEKKLPVYEIARRIAKGKSQLAPIKVTIPEGFNNSEVGSTFAEKLSNFSLQKFALLAKEKEGYLFPDTYFFFFRATEEDVLKLMSSNFETKLAPLQPEITATGKTEKSIIIMASIIEREAKGDDRAVISGILWKRLALGRALEVDAAPETYKTKGLPERPIANPGLVAIKAAIHPENSPYLYYLHDSNGIIHFARNFEEHKANKLKYLK